MDSFIKLNDIFKNHINEIDGNFRQRILTIRDALLFRFKYSQNNVTKDQVAADINMIREINCDSTVYSKKENNIKLSFYESLFGKVKDLYMKDFPKKNYFIHETLKSEIVNDYKLIAVDGTYTNTNMAMKGKLDTSLTMGYFDVNNSVPLCLDFKGNNQNKEIESLYDYLQKTKIEDKTIFIGDRGYFKYDLFKFINDMNAKYVIRIKDNNTLKKKDKKKNNNHNDNIKEYLNDNARLVEVEYEYKKKVITKNNKTEHIMAKSKCILITNLVDKKLYSDECIMNIYRRRWDVEVFFKILKQNYNFANPKEKNPIAYAKLYYVEMIISYIIKMMKNIKMISYVKNHEITKRKHIKKKNGKIVNCRINFNTSTTVSGIYKHLINHIINSSLTFELVNNFIKNYIKNIKYETDRNFERVSKTPFTKWYVKSYHEIYKYDKIITAIKTNDFSKLNKNLKVLANNITIIKNNITTIK